MRESMQLFLSRTIIKYSDNSNLTLHSTMTALWPHKTAWLQSPSLTIGYCVLT